MPEEHIPSQVADALTLGQPIRQDHGITTYPAIHTETGAHYMVRSIQIPADPLQANALLYSGACKDELEVREYFAEKANDIAAQAALLETLSDEGFYPFETCKVIPDEESPTFRVELIRPYLETPFPAAADADWTVKAAIEFGIKLCLSLNACRQAGYLYVNLRPENIFMNEDGEYCITDLGFMKLDTLAYASVPAQYRSTYTPPEIENAYSNMTATLDTYAVGTLLYSIFSGGLLPDKQCPTAPLYADYSLWPILLSACNPDPAERFSDPIAMMQALQAYLDQCNDSTAPVIYVEKAQEEAVQEVVSFLTEEENEAMLVNLLAMIPDEQPQAELSENVTDEDMPDSDDLETILKLADDLICHEPPQPVVVPTPGDFTVTLPIIEEPPVQDSQEEETPLIILPVETALENTPASSAPPAVKSKQKNKEITAIIAAVCCVVVLAIIIGVGVFFYNHSYLQNVNGITVSATATWAKVHVDSAIDDELLTLVCSDAYGNIQRIAIIDGMAEISGLNPSTHYKLSLEISGLHKLTGVTNASFNTEGLTQVQNFSAICGQLSGSAILSFSISGQDSPWILEYSAEGETTRQISFTGTSVTVNNLTVGKIYTFNLLPEKDITLTGQTQLIYTAQAVIVAENIRPIRLVDGQLTVTWNTLGYTGNWEVRCYNGTDYDKTVTVTGNQAIFDGIDIAAGYTVLVTADGMSRSASISISSDPIIVATIGRTEKMDTLLIVWTFEGTAPELGWNVEYSIDGAEPETVFTLTPSAEIPMTAGAHYTVYISAADGQSVICDSYTFDTLV